MCYSTCWRADRLNHSATTGRNTLERPPAAFWRIFSPAAEHGKRKCRRPRLRSLGDDDCSATLAGRHHDYIGLRQEGRGWHGVPRPAAALSLGCWLYTWAWLSAERPGRAALEAGQTLEKSS